MDTFWGSGSVEGRAASFLPDFLVAHNAGSHNATEEQGGSTAERRRLFASTISDALGRYWQEEDDKRTRGQQNGGGGIFLRKERRGKGLKLFLNPGWLVQFRIFAGRPSIAAVCTQLRRRRKRGKRLCLFSITLFCLSLFYHHFMVVCFLLALFVCLFSITIIYLLVFYHPCFCVY